MSEMSVKVLLANGTLSTLERDCPVKHKCKAEHCVSLVSTKAVSTWLDVNPKGNPAQILELMCECIRRYISANGAYPIYATKVHADGKVVAVFFIAAPLPSGKMVIVHESEFEGKNQNGSWKFKFAKAPEEC